MYTFAFRQKYTSVKMNSDNAAVATFICDAAKV